MQAQGKTYRDNHFTEHLESAVTLKALSASCVSHCYECEDLWIACGKTGTNLETIVVHCDHDSNCYRNGIRVIDC